MFMRESSLTTTPNLAQNTGTTTGWDPSTISNIVFGIIMVFVGIIAIWQGRHRRGVVIDEELAIIRPLRTPTSVSSYPHDASLPRPGTRLMLQDASEALPATAHLALAENHGSEERPPAADHTSSIPTISNRVTTLSTIGSIENNNSRLVNGLTVRLDG